MSTLDEFFKEKLADHTVTPSAESWDKVNARLSHNKAPLGWIRWAAALLIGGLLIGTLWLRESEAPLVLTEKKNPTPVKTEVPVKEEIKPAENQKIQQAVVRKKSYSKKSSPQTLIQETTQEKQIAQTQTESIVSPIPAVEIPEGAAISKVPSSIVLTYTLDAIENKTDEATTPVIVASTSKKDNSLKRAMKFARDVKNSEAPLSELRVMKEDLFALDFKKKTTTKKQ